MADLISHGTGQKVPEKVRKTVEVVRLLTKKTPGGVSYKAIGKKLGLDESAARRRVLTASNKGYLKNKETRWRFPAKIVLGEPLPDAREVLPLPEILNATAPEPTANPPANHDSYEVTDSYGRQPMVPTNCQLPGEGPECIKVCKPEAGQAAGKPLASQDANLNYQELHQNNPPSAGWHENQGGMNGKNCADGPSEKGKASGGSTCGSCAHFSPNSSNPTQGFGLCLIVEESGKPGAFPFNRSCSRFEIRLARGGNG